jgi:CBS domain containing-hemolysin-like protein
MRQLARKERESPGLLDSLVRRIRELAGRGESDGGGLRETLEELIEEAEEEEKKKRFTDQERELLLNALSFGELRVDDVMVPRADIRGIAVESTLDQVVAALREAGHSRLIVYRGSLDDVLGAVHVKDLLAFWGDGGTFELERITRPVLAVPPSMRVLDLLLEMRSKRNHMAVVVDEFGGTDGLVTLEDLVEEIVGELRDEHEKLAEPQIVENEDGSLDVDARIYLEDLEERLGAVLLGEEERDEADTLGGLIFALLDRVPAKGEVVRHPGGFELVVLDADPRRVNRVRVRRVAAEPPAGGPAPSRP